jgi:ligand-binding sensor domain-containing protein
LDFRLLHLHQGKIDVFGESGGLSTNTVENLFEDREGNIWVATRNGLDRFRSVVPRAHSVLVAEPCRSRQQRRSLDD